jgi:hypothetical protein
MLRFQDMMAEQSKNGKIILREMNISINTVSVLRDILLTETGKNIVQIDLSKNTLGDRGIELLVPFLVKTKSLFKLQLCSNDVSAHGMSELFSALMKNESLVEIDIGTEDGIARNRMCS